MAVQSGSVVTNTENNNYFWVNWSQYGNQDITNNKTTIYWEAGVYCARNYYSNAIRMSEVVINGSEVYAGGTYSNFYSGSHTIASGYLDIPHNSDGKKTFTISAFTGWLYPNHNYSANATSFELPTIPRASSITAIDANIESATTININRAVSSFTHTITYSFFDLSGTITTKTSNTSIGWTIPSTFYAKIPNAKSGTVTLTCTTYNGNTNIGSKTTTFKVTASEDICKPTITAILIDSNSTTTELTEDNTKLVKYRSTAKITPTAVGINSATISSIKVNNIEISGDYIEIQNVESETFVVEATDSRGYKSSIILEPPVIQYIPLTIDATFKRQSPTSDVVIVNYTGNCFNDNFSPNWRNNFIITLFYRESGQTNWVAAETALDFIKSGNTYSSGGDYELDEDEFDYRKSYEFKINVQDLCSNINFIATVGMGIPYFDYGVDSNGDNYFNINGDLYKDNENALQRHIMTLVKNTNQNITPGQASIIVQMDANKSSTGSKLTFSNYRIKIGSGVSKVLVSGLCWAEQSNGYKWITIRKKSNNTYTTEASAITPRNVNEDWDSVTIAPTLIDVIEDDEISMWIATTGSTTGRVSGQTYPKSTYLTVEVIE